MAARSLYIGFVVQIGFGVVQFLGKVLLKFLRKFWWNFPKAGPIAGAVLSHRICTLAKSRVLYFGSCEDLLVPFWSIPHGKIMSLFGHLITKSL